MTSVYWNLNRFCFSVPYDLSIEKVKKKVSEKVKRTTPTYQSLFFLSIITPNTCINFFWYDDIKLEPVTKPDKRKMTSSKKNLMMTSCPQSMMSSMLFQSMADLEQSWSQIPDAWSVIFIFSLKATLYLTRLETELKNL